MTEKVGEPLPELKEFGIDLSMADVNDKMMLVCFFDVQQRPSRNCMMELAKRSKELKEKDVIIIIVQASKVERAKIDVWIKENEIFFPVGMIEGNEEKTQSAWGIKSLPWLILSDKQHIVRAEGFGLDELDEKIKTLRKK